MRANGANGANGAARDRGMLAARLAQSGPDDEFDPGAQIGAHGVDIRRGRPVAGAGIEDHHAAQPPESTQPVVDVGFQEARAYAAKLKKRLLTPDEWELAIVTVGFTPAGMLLWEWVDDGGKQTAGKQRPVRKAPMGAKLRDVRGWKDVTFRLAMDLPE